MECKSVVIFQLIQENFTRNPISPVKQEMTTPLETTFVTDEQVVAQGDVIYKAKTVESLVVEFDQAKYEEFLSSGSKSPKARVTAESLRGFALKSALRFSQTQLL